MKISDKQCAMLAFIHVHTTTTGHPPSMREIADRMKWENHSTAAQAVNRLQHKGLVTRTPEQKRSVRLTAAGEAEIGVTSVRACGVVVRLRSGVLAVKIDASNETLIGQRVAVVIRREAAVCAA
jgi:SOS-response transcriptional repressor LexA